MKKIVVLCSFIILNVSLLACKSSTKTDAPATPQAVMDAFNTRYPGVNDVKWKEENNNDKVLYDAEFSTNNKKMEARFDDAGNFVDEK